MDSSNLIGESAQQALRVQLLGGFTISVGEITIPESQWKSRRARSLIKILTLAPGHHLHRDQVIDAFWPDSELPAAINNFHQTLYAARRILESAGAGSLLLEEGFLSLSPPEGQRLLIDVEQFEAAAAAANDCNDPAVYENALAIYQGELLPEDLYESWTTARRGSLRQLYHNLLLNQARLLETRQEYFSAIEAIQRLLSEDRGNEEAHVLLMREYALSGQRQQALRQYQTLREVLRAELDVSPSDTTARLYQEIQSNRFPASTAAAGPPAQPEAAPLPAAALRHNLPAQLTSFVGREREIAEICQRVGDHRLVTLTGVGGVGKTRLALQVAESMLDSFPDGVWLVELSPVADPEMIAQAVASALRLQKTSAGSHMSLLEGYLRVTKLLLILDNCEHLLDACARLAYHLLQYCPQLTLLTTSRESLNISGEFAYRVPSLTVPDPDRAISLEDLAQIDSLVLFAHRAAAVRAGFQLTKETLPAAARICYRLDGIPQAIELAAARVDVLSVDQIADRLDDRFRLLTGGSRTAMPRHRTLRASIDWSYNLLSEPERLLLQRLSVFSGGWTLRAAEVVCASEGLERVEILDALAGLVNKSLINEGPQSGAEKRYRMLETIFQYAQERLDASGQGADIRDRHGQYYLNLLISQNKNLKMGTRYQGLPVIDEDDNNIQLAIDWMIERAQIDMLCDMIDTLYSYFWTQSKFHKGESVFNRILRQMEASGALNANCSMPVLSRHSVFQFLTGSYQQAASGLETSLSAARRSGDWPEVAFCLRFLGNLARWLGNNARARQLYRECLDIYNRLGDQSGAAWALIELGGTEEHQGDNEKARKFYEQSLVIDQAMENPEMTAVCLDKLGAVSFYSGEYERSEKYYRTGLEIFQKIGNAFGEALALGGIAWNHWVRGGSRLVEAEQCMRESLHLCRKTGYWLDLVERIGLYGMILNSMGRYEECLQNCMEGLSILQGHKDATLPPLLLTILAEAETHLSDFPSARNHLSQGLSAGMELKKLPTVAISLYCCAELFIEESARMPADNPQKSLLLREAYALAAFVAGSSIAWKVYRDKAAAMVKDLTMESVITEPGLPWVGESESEAAGRALVLLKA